MRHWDHRSEPVAAIPVPAARRRRGEIAHLSGLAAESAVERTYEARGARVLHRRWRGPGGEIDLILAEPDRVVFVEVKKAATHGAAAERVRPAQVQRIARSAMAFVDTLPGGALTDIRLDVALVDGGGAVELLENAFAGCC
ncbi:hypothetical protein OB2597_07370 [Pseudooceanicola batsensis HTCC2597]|uniref:UPF0102 protein OB2597_07370 n=1 Tax=Pseudooceanicola batsensis (strain ATCC BAA-863 / DSM 15984 / KCTC 12145 / HTCC2597) TaxID=252305 RepID=A3TTV9_PSEBH|nr:YraN family protein [Pseudooceanicola batsensis]EAQ05086.1 hypothetical protein OB2597_07370 [Pseudooceanicola batsensis HTCC2597]